ncbi:MAG: acyltransferase [Methylococcales bacterium]
MTGSLARKAAESTLRFGVVRWPLRMAIALVALTERIWSFLRVRALLQVPAGTSCHWSVEIKYPENVRLLGPVIIGPRCTLGAKGGITLGACVRMSKGVLIETASLDVNAALHYPHIAKPVVIEDGVWLGAHSIVLGGVRIGAHAVIGAGTVVSKDIPAGAIVVGGGFRLIEREARQD